MNCYNMMKLYIVTQDQIIFISCWIFGNNVVPNEGVVVGGVVDVTVVLVAEIVVVVVVGVVVDVGAIVEVVGVGSCVVVVPEIVKNSVIELVECNNSIYYYLEN